MAEVPRIAGLNKVAVVLGWLFLAVALDWSVGALSGAVWRPADEGPNAVDPAPPSALIERDPRPDSPALAGAPWAEAYYDELGSLRYEFSPFVITRVADYSGTNITVTDGVRRSYQPSPGSERVKVWFFGGSTMFGEGQRDDHTIASEVARAAESDGVTLQVSNYGQQGLTAWQELLIFESELGRRGPPDIVVFYDGTNEFNAQIEDPGGQPTHLDRALAAEQLAGTGLPRPDQLIVRPSAAWERYSEVSAAGKIWRRLGGLFGATAGATAMGLPPNLEEDVRGQYLRTVDLAATLADRHGVESLFVWQPVGAESANPYNRVGRSLPEPIADLSGLLTGIDEDIFIDGSHTNERGAQIVADELYRLLEPIVNAVRAERD